MKKTALSLVLGATLSVSAFAAKWTGTISDEKCGKAHADASEKSMNCVKGCVKGGKGYWNKVRRDFPEQFEEIAAVQESLGPGANFFRNYATGERSACETLTRRLVGTTRCFQSVD